MVGSKCRDFKNREVNNVNAPTECIRTKATHSLSGTSFEELAVNEGNKHW